MAVKSKTKTRNRTRMAPEQRRLQILIESIGHFSRNGYHETDLQTIAASLEIAKGTIYLYFKTKEELFNTAVEHAVQALADSIHREVMAVDGPVDKIRAIVRVHYTFFYRQRELVQIIIRERGELLARAESTYHRVFQDNALHIENILRDGIRQKIFRKVNTEETTLILASLLTGSIFTHVYKNTRKAMETSIAATCDLLLKGLTCEMNK